MNKIRRRRRREEGASLVEFALIAPILFLLLFGLIDFGFIYNDYLQVRQGVRDGARQGAVANFGPSSAPFTFSQTSCNNDAYVASSAPSEDKALICQLRNRIGLDPSKMRIGICLSNSGGTACNTNASGTLPNPAYTDGRTLIVCAMYPATSRSGFLNPFLSGGVVTTRVAIRIEQTYYESLGSPAGTANVDNLTSTFEDLNTPGIPQGKNWNFCVP
jgi:hypothetical protein